MSIFTYRMAARSAVSGAPTKHADGRYTGRADDVVGEATGQTAGNAFRWNYTLRLPGDDSVYEVQFDDWMFLGG